MPKNEQIHAEPTPARANLKCRQTWRQALYLAVSALSIALTACGGTATIDATTVTSKATPAVGLKTHTQLIKETAVAQLKNHNSLPLKPEDINFTEKQIGDASESVFIISFPDCGEKGGPKLTGFLVKKEGKIAFFGAADHWFSESNDCRGQNRDWLDTKSDLTVEISKPGKKPIQFHKSAIAYEQADQDEELDQQVIAVWDENNDLKDVPVLPFADAFRPPPNAIALNIAYSPTYESIMKKLFINQFVFSPVSEPPELKYKRKYCCEIWWPLVATGQGLIEKGMSGSPVIMNINNTPTAIGIANRDSYPPYHYACIFPLRFSELTDSAEKKFLQKFPDILAGREK